MIGLVLPDALDKDDEFCKAILILGLHDCVAGCLIEYGNLRAAKILCSRRTSLIVPFEQWNVPAAHRRATGLWLPWEPRRDNRLRWTG